MSGFLHVILAFPTSLFTVLMVVVVLYWLLVILGALQVDMFSGHADGAGEGAAEGVGEGAAEGVGEGAGEGAAEGAGHVEAHGHDAADGHDVGDGHDGHEGGDGEHHGGGLSGVLHALGLRSAPLTVVVSLIIFYSWLVLVVAAHWGGPQLAVVLPAALLNTLLVVLAMIIAIALASFTSRPFGRIFIAHPAPQRSSLVGQRCTITTGRVDNDFGQAEVEDGGAGFLIQIRCDRENRLGRGEQAMIMAYDERREAFLVEAVWDGGTRESDSGRGAAA